MTSITHQCWFNLWVQVSSAGNQQVRQHYRDQITLPLWIALIITSNIHVHHMLTALWYYDHHRKPGSNSRTTSVTPPQIYYPNETHTTPKWMNYTLALKSTYWQLLNRLVMGLLPKWPTFVHFSTLNSMLLLPNFCKNTFCTQNSLMFIFYVECIGMYTMFALTSCWQTFMFLVSFITDFQPTNQRLFHVTFDPLWNFQPIRKLYLTPTGNFQPITAISLLFTIPYMATWLQGCSSL